MLQVVGMLVSRYFRYVVKDQKGVTAIEYSLIAALIAIGIIFSAGAVGDSVVKVFTDISNALDPVVDPPPAP